MDSNHDKGLQRALCYHYTIGQPSALNLPEVGLGANRKFCDARISSWILSREQG